MFNRTYKNIAKITKITRILLISLHAEPQKYALSFDMLQAQNLRKKNFHNFLAHIFVTI